MLGLFTIPDPSAVIASSSGSVSTYLGELSALYPFLGVMLATIVFGLGVWSVTKLAKGGTRTIKSSMRGGKRGRGRRR